VTHLVYGPALKARIPTRFHDSDVARLCDAERNSDLYWQARLIECWAARYIVKTRMIRRLTGPDNDQFQAAWWELAAARALELLDFRVQVEPSVGGLTPDLLVRGTIGAFVEVLSQQPAHATLQEESRMKRLETALLARLNFAEGFVSISLRRDLSDDPPDADIDALAKEVQRWLDRGHPGFGEDLSGGGIQVSATWMPHNLPPDLAVTPSARAIGESKRLQGRLEEKVNKYTAEGESLVLFVGTDGHWTQSIDDLINAMLGAEQVTISGDPPTAGKLHFSGHGAIVAGGPSGQRGAEFVPGAFYMVRD
jgi:hypothetical protein